MRRSCHINAPQPGCAWCHARDCRFNDVLNGCEHAESGRLLRTGPHHIHPQSGADLVASHAGEIVFVAVDKSNNLARLQIVGITHDSHCVNWILGCALDN